MLKARMSFHHYDSLQAEVVVAAKPLMIVDFLHPVMVLELFVPEVALVPSVILMPIAIPVVAIGVPVPMPRVFLVFMPVAVAVVIAVMLRESGNTRRYTQSQNGGKAYSNQSHRCLSTAK
jgi:hypothetical protein